MKSRKLLQPELLPKKGLSNHLLFGKGLIFTNTFYELFAALLLEINPIDFGSVPPGVPGYMILISEQEEANSKRYTNP